MFEGIVASLLNRYLGKYIEDLDLESLNVGIFGGNVLLSGLKLKTEALVTCKIIYYTQYTHGLSVRFEHNVLISRIIGYLYLYNKFVGFFFPGLRKQYELGLPVEVKAGSIGKFNVNIPWNGLSSQPVVIKIEVSRMHTCLSISFKRDCPYSVYK